MTTRLERLRTFFAPALARNVARAAPLLFVASASGALIGADLAGATTLLNGLVTMGAGFGTNILASMVYDLLKPDLDDDQRAAQIVQALEARDPASAALVAATLIEAGPELAQALPETGRALLIGGLEAGMQQAEGALAAIAPRYAAGLRDGQTDWAALQAVLRQAVAQTVMHIQVGDEGQIRNVLMDVSNTPGNVDMRITAGNKALIQDTTMKRSGPAPAPSQPCPDCRTPVAAGLIACPRCGATLTAA